MAPLPVVPVLSVATPLPIYMIAMRLVLPLDVIRLLTRSPSVHLTVRGASCGEDSESSTPLQTKADEVLPSPTPSCILGYPHQWKRCNREMTSCSSCSLPFQHGLELGRLREIRRTSPGSDLRLSLQSALSSRSGRHDDQRAVRTASAIKNWIPSSSTLPGSTGEDPPRRYLTLCKKCGL